MKRLTDSVVVMTIVGALFGVWIAGVILTFTELSVRVALVIGIAVGGLGGASLARYLRRHPE